ncbi:MAG: energy transducer TonB [Acidobacteriaceae bacterium]
MGNPVMSAPEKEPQQEQHPIEDPSTILQETDGSIWSSLLGNLRDAFSSGKQPPLELTSQPVEVGETVPVEPIWLEIWHNLQDTFFPKKLPPLELTSQPVAVVDPLAVKRDAKSSAISAILHALIIALIILFGLLARHVVVKEKAEADNSIPLVPMTMPQAQSMGGGGGGGAHEVVQASKGKLPKFEKLQITPPSVIKVDHPIIPVPPSVQAPPMNLPNQNLPNIGVTNSPQVKLASNGTGGNAGIGSGNGTGLGAGNGAGVGSGSGQGMGGGVYNVGGGVSAPVAIYAPEPEFSDEARRAKYQGVVDLQIIVTKQGLPADIKIVRHLGMGLDEKAIEAVRKYRFRPAMYHGHPVAVRMIVEVDFHLF